jgi:glutamate synthase domain-containing protein 2
MEIVLIILAVIIVNQIIYDKYIQRRHQLLINYPLVGRMRYVFEALREPFRQYFGGEDFYDSKDKIDWVYDASNNKSGYISFAPNSPQQNPKFMIKHSNRVLNDDEIDENLTVTFGASRPKPFISPSIIGRSAMSDGAISPEGTKAFAIGAKDGNFPINCGEGSLTSNFFASHIYKKNDNKYLESIELTSFQKKMFALMKTIGNNYVALNYFKKRLLPKGEADTYSFDFEHLLFFRPDWQASFENFPTEVPDDMPNITFQMSSGLYGVRTKDGNFDEDRYKKTMAFCRMTEIKLAQGAKQTGGKLMAEKVTSAIAYYRGIEAGKGVMSPNRFPYASDMNELFDFVAKLQELSSKPVGFKIVISCAESFTEYVQEIKRRKENNIPGIPDFISIDGGDGGSATAPLFLMDRVGLHIKDAIHIADTILKKNNLRDDIKLIASSKILTPDDIVITMALGADFVNIARGFMLSAGCIRAKMCSGEGSHQCPVGLATQNEKLRKSYLLHKNANKIKNYHNSLIRGVKTILAIMGKENQSKLDAKDVSFVDKNGFIHTNVSRYFDTQYNA